MSSKEWILLAIGVLLAAVGIAVSQGYPPGITDAHWLPIGLFVAGGIFIVVSLWGSGKPTQNSTPEHLDPRAIEQTTPGKHSTAVAVGSVGKGNVSITINHPPSHQPTPEPVGPKPIPRPTSPTLGNQP